MKKATQKVFINPEIIEEVGSESGVEGCLSVKSSMLRLGLQTNLHKSKGTR